MLFITSLLPLSPSTLHAAVIDFGGLTGPNGAAFPSPYTEAGYVVTATQGNWVEGQSFGNPVPSIFDGAGSVPLVVSSIRVAKTDGGAFTFSSVDLASNNGPSTYTFTGDGLSQTGTVTANLGLFTFNTYTNSSPFLELTSLTITVNPTGETSSYNLDNIVVNAVIPEPATFALLGLPLAVALVARRKRLTDNQ